MPGLVRTGVIAGRRSPSKGDTVILVTGGLGFIGLHTGRALIDLGEDVVLTQYRVAREPDFIKPDLGKHAFVEQLDVADADGFERIGAKYPITGIVHMAVPGLNALNAADDYRTNMNGLLNCLQYAEKWEVKRITVASSNTVYTGVKEIPEREDIPLSMAPNGPTEAFKKAFEILGTQYANRTGLSYANLRISGIWGPLYHSMMNLQSRLVHAAVHGRDFDPGPRGPAFAGAGHDITYVKDTGKGCAMVQLAETLNHKTYNVSSGRPTINHEFVAAIQKVIPEFDPKLPDNPNGAAPVNYQDLTRVREEIGFEPDWDTERAVADYIAWLRAGNPE